MIKTYRLMISPKRFLFIAPLLIFFLTSAIWFSILSQTISFVAGFIVLIFVSFFIFWRGLLILRRAGELFGLRSKKQIFVVSLAVALSFGEMFWAISFLPLRFFILGGLFVILFMFAFSIFKEYFKQDQNSSSELTKKVFKKVLTKNIILSVILIIILISISSWLPPKTF